MNITFKYDCTEIDFLQVIDILKVVGMTYHALESEKQAFENSSCVIFAFDNGRLIGFARAISDRTYQAAIYDMAILPSYQGQGLGKKIIEEIKKQLTGYNIILYASPGKEDFYRKLGFRKMLTGMALFVDASTKQQAGFIE